MVVLLLRARAPVGGGRPPRAVVGSPGGRTPGDLRPLARRSGTVEPTGCAGRSG